MHSEPTTKIFIIEDQGVVALDLAGRLRDLGYEVCGAVGRGEDAIERILAASPDILLVDIQLAGKLDGIGLVEEVRRKVDLGVIYLTAYADANVRRRVRPTEPDAYLIKPIDDRLLEVTVDMVSYRVHADRLRRHSARLLREREAQLADAQRIAHLGSFEIDLETERTQWSDELFRILGTDPAHATPSVDALLAAIHEDDRPPRPRFLEAQARPRQLRLRTTSGEVRHVELRTSLRGHDRDATQLVGSMQDVTERRRVENRLVHISKMEAIGTLAAGVAHDFNNRLMAILGFAGLLEFTLQDDEQWSWATRIRELCESASEIASKLLTLSRREGDAGRAANLGRTILDAKPLLEAALGPGVVIETQTPEEPLYVEASPPELQEVLMALASNAAQAMPNGGTLKIVVSRVEPSPGAEWVRWDVLDDGMGMDEATRSRACDAFFTTKPSSEGTGLGLAIVRGFALARGGNLEIESTPREGTKVSLHLPRIATVDTSPTSDVRVGPTLDNLRMLLVVDDHDLELALATYLRRSGCIVESTSDTKDAVQRALDNTPDIVLIDLASAPGNATTLTEHLRRNGITRPIMVMAGGPDRKLELALRSMGAQVVRKPLTLQELGARMHKVATIERLQDIADEARP